MRAMLLLSILLLPLCALAQEPASTADATAEIAEPGTRIESPSRSALYEQALERKLPTQEQRKLDFNGESQLGLYMPAARPEGLGGVLLIAGPGEHADWPNLIAPLRRQLSDAGWNTLSIGLPDSPPLPDSALNDTPTDNTDPQDGAVEQGLQAADNQPDQAPPAEDAAADYATRCTQLIQAAWKVLSAEGNEYITVIARDASGYWALRAASPPVSGQPPQALILFQPREPELADQPTFQLLLEQWDKPLLELINSGSAQGEIQAREHQRIAQRAGHAQYKQWDTDYLLDSMLAEDMLQKRIEGWLERLVETQAAGSTASAKAAMTP